MATSLTLGNILKINSNSRHTPEVRHTSIYQLSYWEREARKHRRNGWSSNRKASIGKFTVSSAYKVIIAVSSSSDNGAPFDCQKRSTFWKTVWVPRFQTRSKLSLGGLAKIFCSQRLTFAIEESLTTLFVKLAIWRLRLVHMCLGTVKRHKKHGKCLVFQWIPVGLTAMSL